MSMSSGDRRKSLYENPVTAPLKDFVKQLTDLKFLGVNFFPSVLVAIVLSVIVLLLGLLWPYGIIVISSRRLWDFVAGTRDEMQGKTLIEKVPYTITIGIFFIVWIPFSIICIPFYVVGLIGRIIASE